MSLLGFFLKIYVPLAFAFLNFLYFQVRVFYRPLFYKDKKTGETIDVHKLYDAFRSKDRFNYFEVVIVGLFFFPIKFLSCLSVITCIMIHLKIASLFYPNPGTNPEHRKKIESIVKFWARWYLRTSMVYLKEKKVDNCEEVYKKYLGADYDFNEKRYSVIICNHLGFLDVISNMALHSPGFIAKEAISRYVLIGTISKSLNCLFVNRESESARKDILERLHQRQVDFYEGKSLAPLILFPEGTTTAGRNLLRFKKGAFYYLLPIKPEIINFNQDSAIHLACGSQNLLFHTCKNLCYYFPVELYYINMPIIKPTQFMFDNYSHLGKEKWEIYAEVVRKIYCEIGGFKESEMGYRDSHSYNQAMISGVYDPEKLNKKTI